MSGLYAVADSKFFIGGVLASTIDDMEPSDFASQTWVEVDGWETAGALGDSAEVIKTPLINRGRVAKQKGTNDAGTFECNFASLPSDPGQIALAAAQESSSTYAIKVEWSDGVTEMFVALVMSKTRAGGNANTVHMIGVTLEVDSNVVAI